MGEHGVKANLVHIWVGLYRKAQSRVQVTSLMSADNGKSDIPFPSWLQQRHYQRRRRATCGLDIRLGNGVQADLKYA
jgi:hypothetical protein